jgi:hypothetical protein
MSMSFEVLSVSRKAVTIRLSVTSRVFISYLFAVFLGCSILINALLGGLPYQTLSARCHLLSQGGGRIGEFGRSIVDWVALAAFRENRHCEDAADTYLRMADAIQGDLEPVKWVGWVE